MKRSSRFHSLALATVLALQTIGAPVVEAAGNNSQLSAPTEVGGEDVPEVIDASAKISETNSEGRLKNSVQSSVGNNSVGNSDQGNPAKETDGQQENAGQTETGAKGASDVNEESGNKEAENQAEIGAKEASDINEEAGNKEETADHEESDVQAGSDNQEAADNQGAADNQDAAGRAETDDQESSDVNEGTGEREQADNNEEAGNEAGEESSNALDSEVPAATNEALAAEDSDEASLEDDADAATREIDGKGDAIWTVDMSDLSQFDIYSGPGRGEWSSTGDSIRVDGGNGNKIISKRQDFEDFVLEADVTVEKQADMSDKSSAQGGILFRASKGANNQNDGYFGYYLGVNAHGQLILGRSSGNNWYEIATQKMNAEFGKTYHLTVVANGYHITCYADYNGENLATIEVNDNTHQMGGVGMRNWLSHSSFKNMVVSEYKDPSSDDYEEGELTKEEVEERINKALDGIEIPSSDAIRGNITLPDKSGKVELSWESDNEDVITSKDQPQDGYYDIPAGVVTRGESDEEVTLTVTATLQGVSQSRDIQVRVLAAENKDEDYTGYLYAHFKEIAGEKGEQDIFYGLSEDGLNWTALNGNEAILKSDVGDKATRDPYIIRSAEGDRFFLLATDQDIYKYGSSIPWDKLSTQGSTALTIWESTDLVNWTNERNVDVAGSIGGGCAWAPEAIYDEATGEYLVYWASKIAADNFARQYTFVSRTRDFYTFTEPELFNDFGSNIDTSMLKVGDDYYRLTKMEDGMYVRLDKASGKLRSYGDDVTEKTIGNQTFKVVGNNYSYIKNTASDCLESFRGNYEGGTMFKFNDRDEWCVMLDEYGGAARGYIPFVTGDLGSENTIKVLSEDEYTPQEGCKHGVILPVTSEEYEALIEAYGVKDGLIASMDVSEEPVAEYDFEEAFDEKPASDKNDASDKKVTSKGADLGLVLQGNAELKDDAESGKVLYLDGGDGSFAEFTPGVFDALDEMTLSLDVKPQFADASTNVVSLGSDADKYMYLSVTDDEISAGSTARGANGIKSVNSSNYGTYGRWVHLDLVVKDHTLSLYTDGILAGTVKNRNISELGRDLNMYLGRSFAGGRNFSGSIDNVKIYNKAFTMEELGAKKPQAITVKIEAESGVVSGKAKVASRGDASGGYKVGYIDDTSSTVTMKINAPQDGTYRVDIAADGDKGAFPNSSHRYWVNGDEASAKIVEYTKATNWDIWSLYSVYVDLKEGENTFTISHSGIANSFAEVDYIVFHALEEPGYDIMLGDKALEGFDKEKKIFNVDLEDSEKLPTVSVKFEDGADTSFKAKVTQATEDKPECYVTVYTDSDPSYVSKYTIRFNYADTFTSSLVNYGADPFVTYHDGYYYYVRMGRNDSGIWVTKAAELSRIGKVEPVCVYMPSGDEPTRELWAPELHFIDGKWYIYYTAGAGANHRMMVLESETDDAQGKYIFKGKMSPETDRWAIDQTVLEIGDQLYAIWSGWDGFVDGEQRLYIAKMDDPVTISGDRVELSRPEYAWEVNEHPTINEGPEIAVSPDGTVNIVYSASGSWSDTYCLGCLTLKKGADPMKADSWIKASKPIFEKNDSTTFSTGHASFVKSPDGKEDYLVYHATRFAGTGWNGRGVRAQRVYWLESGVPYIGIAAEYTDKVKVPSGTKKVVYNKYEAEDAILTKVNMAETYNSSANGCVYGLKDENTKAEFTVNVDEAGEYMLYVGASANVNNAGIKIIVNGSEYEKEVYNFNANAASRLVVDNWFGYEQEISLNKGSNTIVISGDSGKETAALDYIEVCKLEDALKPNPKPSDDQGNDDNEPVKPEDPNGNNENNENNPKTPGSTENGSSNDNKAPVVENTDAAQHTVGEEVTCAGAIYVITGADDAKSVKYVKPESKKASSVTIPNTVSIDGEDYRVTELGAGAFKNNKNLKKVSIGENVEKIGKKAFYKCKNLKKLTITSTYLTKKSVGKNAFKGIDSKAKVVVPATKLKDYKKILKAKGISKKTQTIKKQKNKK
ncbi:MAG: hypothetical protein E7301_09160 [Butyrivibrio sp.]|nr:hypothetical protein [Butyrivibrio sp.]